MYLSEFIEMLERVYRENGDMLVLDGMFEPYVEDCLTYGFGMDKEGNLVPTLRV